MKSNNTMNTNKPESVRKIHRKKGTLAALALSALLLVQAVAALPVSAVYDPENPNPVYEDGMMYIMAVPISAEVPVAPTVVTWDGAALDLGGLTPYVSEAGHVMVPLRAIMEGMGYQVNWLAETNTAEMIRGAHWVTLTPGEDVYTFGKMAPGKLGIPSEIKDNRTYVPIAFFTETLPFFAAQQEDGTLAIVSEQPEAAE
jgi:hypothetical protein